LFKTCVAMKFVDDDDDGSLKSESNQIMRQDALQIFTELGRDLQKFIRRMKAQEQAEKLAYFLLIFEYSSSKLKLEVT